MSATDLQPGTTVHLKVVHEPTNAPARKTIVRLLSKDEAVTADHERLRKARKKNNWKNQRGGRVRLWQGRQVKLHPVTGTRGETGTFRAGTAELRDLKSVARFVEVSAA